MRLLVSVTGPAEVRAAIEGGADIIDAKDASRGALGAVTASVMRDIVAAVGGDRPVSVALGDVGDAQFDDLGLGAAGNADFEALLRGDSGARDADVGAADSSVTRLGAGSPSRGVSFVKLGFAAGVDGRRAAACVRSVVAGLAGTGTSVVLAAYADAGSDRLGRTRVVEIAARCEVAGVLLDTLDKQRSQTLFTLLGPVAVADWVVSAHQAGLTVALAGSLGVSEIAVARDIGADVVGVRGAACEGGRLGRVSVERVRDLAAQMAVSPSESLRSPALQRSPRPTPGSESARV
jgi:hypothetical protein